MKAPITIMLEAGLIDKLDELRIKRGTNRSETIRHIMDEYFQSGTNLTDLIDKLELMKGRNIELRYQIETMRKDILKYHEQTMDLLLVFASLNPRATEIVKEKFPEYCPED